MQQELCHKVTCFLLHLRTRSIQTLNQDFVISKTFSPALSRLNILADLSIVQPTHLPNPSVHTSQLKTTPKVSKVIIKNHLVTMFRDTMPCSFD
jgi:hypothetical protein